MKFKDLKVGDKVMRILAGIPMPMIITKMDHLIHATALDRLEIKKVNLEDIVHDPDWCWTFSRKTGAEEDSELEWGDKFGHTGSYLVIEDEI